MRFSRLVSTLSLLSNNEVINSLLFSNVSRRRFIANMAPKPLGYVDAHCHLFNSVYNKKYSEMAEKCREAGVECIIINGLDPETNRETLEMCEGVPEFLPACGIYPLEACCNVLNDSNWKNKFPPPKKFDVDAEVDFIDELCAQKKIVAIGEAGLDMHYVSAPEAMAEQERVLRKLMRLSVKHDIPIILHTRKAEQRTFELLLEEKVTKADIHCFCGTTELGLKYASAGYHLSIPSHVANPKSKSFRALAAALPLNRLLTETDSPYMAPDKSQTNDPTTVVRSIETFAELRGKTHQEMKRIVRKNFRDLFGV